MVWYVVHYSWMASGSIREISLLFDSKGRDRTKLDLEKYPLWEEDSEELPRVRTGQEDPAALVRKTFEYFQ